MKGRRPIALLALAHMSCDLTQGALSILLPPLMAVHHINYAAAAGVVFTSNLVSTITQPLLGYVSDRRSRPWLIPVGVLLAVIGFSCIGLAPAYGLVLLAVAVSGLGVGMFHPEGARHAHRIAGEKKATTMSLFTFGGQIGFALGPLLATALVLRTGLAGTLYLVLPGLFITGFLWHRLRSPDQGRGGRHGGRAPMNRKGDDRWPAFVCLSAAAVLRSVVFYGLNTFLPLFWINILNQSKAAGGAVLTILATCSMIGNLLGGKIADRVGYRIAILVEFALLTCFIPFLPMAGNATTALLLVLPIGLLLSAPSSSVVVLGQNYLPNHIGLSSGITMGVAFSFGGLVMPLLGWVADRYGLRAAMMTFSIFPLLCTGLALALPRAKKEEPAPEYG